MPHKIGEKEKSATISIINTIGFDNALEKAYQKALLLVETDPYSTLATTWLSWSENLLYDSRKPEFEKEREELLLLSKFYRFLAHKVYWRLFNAGSIGEINGFIRLVKCP